jgi:hypothetical protein
MNSTPNPDDARIEQIIEHVVLNVLVPDDTSAESFRTACREFSKTIMQIRKLDVPSDAIVDKIVAEMIEWHAPRPDEPGWNPDLANAPVEEQLMAWKRHRDAIAEEERKHEVAQFVRQDNFESVREDAARRRMRGDHEGAEFLERWLAKHEAAE